MRSQDDSKFVSKCKFIYVYISLLHTCQAILRMLSKGSKVRERGGSMCVCVCVRARVCVCAYTLANTNAPYLMHSASIKWPLSNAPRTPSPSQTHTHTFTPTHTHTHTPTHPHTHTHIHTHTLCRCRHSWLQTATISHLISTSVPVFVFFYISLWV